MFWADDFEVAIFLRKSLTRHSLLTRHKTFDQPVKSEETGDSKNLPACFAGSADAEVIIESDSDPEFDLGDIPPATEDDTSLEDSVSSRRKKPQIDQVEGEVPIDEKKLGFSTRYESFNICGWVLCLLITRKSDRTRKSATAEPKQPLIEEWISTHAQPVIDED